jgi:RNA polymerase subunit RPABC4/transcription elongation factor Spt4
MAVHPHSLIYTVASGIMCFNLRECVVLPTESASLHKESTSRMDFESILATIQPFAIMLAALIAAFLTAIWISAVIWAFRDIRARSRDVFAQILATLMVLLFFPLFPLPGLILYWILRPRETLSEIYERSLEEEALLQGIEERLACPGCNRRIEENFLVCPTCHTRLKKKCPACESLLHLRWNICPYCGTVQTAAKAAPVIAPQPVVMQVEAPYDDASIAGEPPSSLPEPVVEGEVEAINSSDAETAHMSAYRDEPSPETEPVPPVSDWDDTVEPDLESPGSGGESGEAPDHGSPEAGHEGEAGAIEEPESFDSAADARPGIESEAQKPEDESESESKPETGTLPFDFG